MALDRLPPNRDLAEKALLGSIFLDPSALLAVGKLQAADFYNVRHEWIFEAMQRVAEQGVMVDTIGVSEQLNGKLQQIGGLSYLSKLELEAPSIGAPETYAKQIRGAALRRKMLAAASEIARLAYDEALTEEEAINGMESQTAAIASDRDELRQTTYTAREGSKLAIDATERAYVHGWSGIKTGLTDLDNLIAGFEEQSLNILAGRPGSGKTAAALTFVKNHCEREMSKAPSERRWIYFASLEMSVTQLINRLAAMLTGVSTTKQKTGDMSEAEYAATVTAKGTIAEWPLVMFDGVDLTPANFRSQVKREHAKHPLALVIVDHIQLQVSPGEQNRTQEVSVITRNLKTLAKEFNVPVLALSQLNRKVEDRADKRPQLADLRDSGSIEQDADIVIFIYRDEMYNDDTQRPNQADFLVAKNRDGATGVATAFFRKEHSLFGNLTKVDIDLAMFNDDNGAGVKAEKDAAR